MSHTDLDTDAQLSITSQRGACHSMVRLGPDANAKSKKIRYA